MISVIISTRNRSGWLQRSLESLQAATPPSDDWELLVVDNNSSDATRRVLQEFACRGALPIRLLFEARVGKTVACNRAIRTSRGSLLAFTDDDTIIERGWLASLERAERRWPDVTGFGGRTVAVWTCPRPRWFDPEQPLRSCTGGVLAFDLRDVPFELRQGEAPAPVGANLAVRRHAFERLGLFREDLGPGPLKYLADDTEFFYRLRNAGERVMYLPDAIVQHPVDPFRLRRRYALEWAYHRGRTSARMRGRRPGTRCIAGVPIYLFRMLGRDLASLAAGGMSISAVETHRQLQVVASRLGVIREMHRLQRDFDPTLQIPTLREPEGGAQWT